jgi:hypothetical protein
MAFDPRTDTGIPTEPGTRMAAEQLGVSQKGRRRKPRALRTRGGAPRGAIHGPGPL